MSKPIVEKGVPVPRRAVGAPAKWPFAELHVGDSFVATDVKRGSMSCMAYAAGKRLSMKFTTRTVKGGTRVWRTA